MNKFNPIYTFYVQDYYRRRTEYTLRIVYFASSIIRVKELFLHVLKLLFFRAHLLKYEQRISCATFTNNLWIGSIAKYAKWNYFWIAKVKLFCLKEHQLYMLLSFPRHTYQALLLKKPASCLTFLVRILRLSVWSKIPKVHTSCWNDLSVGGCLGCSIEECTYHLNYSSIRNTE